VVIRRFLTHLDRLYDDPLFLPLLVLLWLATL